MIQVLMTCEERLVSSNFRLMRNQRLPTYQEDQVARSTTAVAVSEGDGVGGQSKNDQGQEDDGPTDVEQPHGSGSRPNGEKSMDTHFVDGI